MRLAVSTVRRGAEIHRSGELRVVDLDTGRVSPAIGAPTLQPTVEHDANPRGNTRGLRGIAVDGDRVVVSDYHTMHVHDLDLVHVRRLEVPLLAGVHELFANGDGTVWVASTANDGAVLVRVADATVVDSRWPRTMPGIVAALGVDSQPVDLAMDHRLAHVRSNTAPSHLHLNAVAVIGGSVVALSNRFGAVLDLDDDQVVLRSPALRGAHDLVPFADGTVGIVSTQERRLHVYEPDRWQLVGAVDLTGGAARSLWLEARVRHAVLVQRRRRGGVHVPKAMFTRGLVEAAPGEVLVGASPAAVLRVERASGAVTDVIRIGGGLDHCVHGIAALR